MRRLDTLERQVSRWDEGARALHHALATPYPIAASPHEVVWTLNKARLLRYRPTAPPERRHGTPLLLVYALMNRPWILDLRPGHSFVEHMVARGYDVFLVDWGDPGPEDAGQDLAHYVLDLLPRILRRVRRIAGTDDVDVLGWCIGALLTLMHAALRPDEAPRSLVTLTVPADHGDRGAPGFQGWVDRRVFDVDLLLARVPNAPGRFVEHAAKALRPVENHLTYYLKVLRSGGDPRVVEPWHAMDTWLTDNIDIAGAFYRQLVTEIYNEDQLVLGTLRLRGERVDLGAVRPRVLNVLAREDHLVPACQAETLPRYLTGAEEVRQLVLPGGHIGLMAGSRARRETWPLIDGWLAEAR